MQTFFLKDTVRVHLSNEIGQKIKKNDRIALILSIGGALMHVFAVSLVKFLYCLILMIIISLFFIISNFHFLTKKCCRAINIKFQWAGQPQTGIVKCLFTREKE